MANNCAYDMKIIGSKASCLEWLRLMTTSTSENAFHRFYEAYVYDESGTEQDYCLYITGDCAWSLDTCRSSSGKSELPDLFAFNSKRLGIIMEAWSAEPGLCFQEHFIYDIGECKADECLEWEEFYWDKRECPTYAEYKQKYQDVPPEDEFSDDYAERGGFDNYGEWTI